MRDNLVDFRPHISSSFYLLALYLVFLLEHLLFLVPGFSGCDALSVTYLLLYFVVCPLFWAVPSWLASLGVVYCHKKGVVWIWRVVTVLLGGAPVFFC